MSELALRVITAVVLVAAVLVWYLCLPESWYAGVLVAASLLAIHELLRLSRLGYEPVYLLLAAPIMVGVVYVFALAGLVFLLLAWFAVFVWASRRGEVSFASFLGACWMAAWLAVFVWSLAVAHVRADGAHLIAAVCLGVWSSDIAAYCVGRTWGKHRLCPSISPGKTIEGLIAGLVAGIAVTAGLLQLWHSVSLLQGLLLALLAVSSGVMGDLAESAFKRMQGVKDSGTILPGHGGILDRIDAIMFAVPVAYLGWGYLR